MKEAQAWLGGGSSLLGRAHQLGPHPYATMTLFPADAALSKSVPVAKAPFQVWSFAQHHCMVSMILQPCTWYIPAFTLKHDVQPVNG